MEAIHQPAIPEFICEYRATVRDAEGYEYTARVYGVPQGTGIWDAWIIFFPEAGGGLRRTERETEQASRRDLASWAARLTPSYLEGALERSRPFREAGSRAPEHVGSWAG